MIEIRPYLRSDVADLQRLANNAMIPHFTRDRFPHPYTMNDAELWIEVNENASPVLNFAIAVDGNFAGGIGLMPQYDINRFNAEVGYWLGEPYHGRGIMTAALTLLIDHAFNKLTYVRLYANVFEHNAASMRVLEKAGFYKESIQRKAAYKNGNFIDEHVYALLKPGIL
ncbi:GNAT family N-acetyltransferase [Pedobacter sp. HMF7647]|uniref:GNAT family N-acetyltransferase n=2 Tax=Hufsiella arboris TaxID=2695275 RepID=A0A7K1Y671_9SPHI|nr:GNAT family N-acetyltransferase [Hufsiella arboris]